jgi:DNA polymerase-3 subunit epsilon
MEARIAESNARLEEERNRLAALMSELSEGVLVCNTEGRILLYNEQARALFTPVGPGAVAAQSPVGSRAFGVRVPRPRPGHARPRQDPVQPRPRARHAVTLFLTTSAAGGLVRVRLAPFLAIEGSIGGMVLTLEDVTAAFGQEAQRRSLLQALATRVRQPAANVRAAGREPLLVPRDDEAERARFTEIIAAESRGLSETIDEALRATPTR